MKQNTEKNIYGHKNNTQGERTEWEPSAKIMFTAPLYYGQLLYKNFLILKGRWLPKEWL